MAKISDNWQNSIPIGAYFEFARQKNNVSIYSHPDIDSETVKKVMAMIRAGKKDQTKNTSGIEGKNDSESNELFSQDERQQQMPTKN